MKKKKGENCIINESKLIFLSYVDFKGGERNCLINATDIFTMPNHIKQFSYDEIALFFCKHSLTYGLHLVKKNAISFFKSN